MLKEIKQPCVIYDLDGTLTDPHHRLHYLKQSPRNWGAFFDACVDDDPNRYFIRLYHIIQNSGISIVIFTGRPESHRKETLTWLEDYAEITKPVLVMRETGDFRDDFVVKKEMLATLVTAGINALFCVDDRPSVIKMWSDNGIPCLQVDNAHW